MFTKCLRHLWVIGGGIVALTSVNYFKSHTVYAIPQMRKIRSNDISIVDSGFPIFTRDDEIAVRLTPRERRFIRFSSVEFEGQLYMTPQDFLDSILKDRARPRLKRYALTKSDVEKVASKTPSLADGSKLKFRKLRYRGIISFAEYLFLLSVLTKPETGFHIAFKMFDTDGNEVVDKNEFLIIQEILGNSFTSTEMDENTRKVLLRLITSKDHASETLIKKSAPKKTFDENDTVISKVFGKAWRKMKVTKDEKNMAKIEKLKRHIVDTTLLIHLFGKDGKRTVSFKNFKRFMENLQDELLECEFEEFSKGTAHISDIEFAKILLRHTYLSHTTYDEYLTRVMNSTKNEKGVHYTDFRDFYRFLNNLDDFAHSIRLYTSEESAISKPQFKQAIKICAGVEPSDHLIDVIYAMFDKDNDGRLSHSEFIAVMKNRLQRNYKKTKSSGWAGFKKCVKHEASHNQ